MHCINPGPALSPEATEHLLGVAGVRHLFVDCGQTQVWPGSGLRGGGPPGWTIAPGLAADEQTVYRHRATAQAPDYVVSYSANLAPSEALSGKTTANTAELLTYEANGSEWLTVWQVITAPEARLSVQAHLLDADGNVLAVADSLGFSSDQWQPGDVFGQRFNFGSVVGGAFLETGLYDYVTGERYGPLHRLPVDREAGK
jgi:hypothetical protein